MPKNGRSGNGNGLHRRLGKLEAGFNALIESLHATAIHILADTNEPELIHLLNTPGAREVNRLCAILRKLQADAHAPPSRRLSAGILLTCIELKHSVQGRS